MRLSTLPSLLFAAACAPPGRPAPAPPSIRLDVSSALVELGSVALRYSEQGWLAGAVRLRVTGAPGSVEVSHDAHGSLCVGAVTQSLCQPLPRTLTLAPDAWLEVPLWLRIDRAGETSQVVHFSLGGPRGARRWR